VTSRRRTDGPMALCGIYDVVKDSVGDRPSTNDLKAVAVVLRGQPGSALSTSMR